MLVGWREFSCARMFLNLRAAFCLTIFVVVAVVAR